MADSAKANASKDTKATKTDKAAPTTAPKPKRRLVQKILLGLVAFIVILIIVVYIATNGAVKVSNEYLRDIQAGRSDAAYSLFSREAKEATSQQNFRQIVKRIGPILNTKAKMTSREIQDPTGAPATATITYEITGTDKVAYKITVQLVKEDGEWKINSFDSSKR